MVNSASSEEEIPSLQIRSSVDLRNYINISRLFPWISMYLLYFSEWVPTCLDPTIDCSNNGNCVDKRCVCDEGFHGLLCDSE